MTNNDIASNNLSSLPDESAFEGRFNDFEQIGEGGIGSVYKAHDTILEKIVAIKVLKLEHGHNEKQIARLQKEAKALAKLSHPSIITIFDFGLSKNDEPYIVMEYLFGYTLDSYLKSEEYFEWDNTFDIFEQVAKALQYAHDKGIVHKDLKPSNVFISDVDSNPPVIKLIDFGISTIAELDQGQTTSGTIIGSPIYMSPEQTQSSNVDSRSDIYSFGCLIFRTLTGKMPIEGSTANETILLKRTKKPPKLSSARLDIEFHPSLEEFVDKCLQINPADRYESMYEVLKAINATVKLEQEEESQKSESNEVPGKTKVNLYIGVILSFLILLCLILFMVHKKETDSVIAAKTKPKEKLLEGISKTVSKANVEENLFSEKPKTREFHDSDGNKWIHCSGSIDGNFIRKLKRYNYYYLYHLPGNITDDILIALVDKKPLGLNLNKSGLTDRQFTMLTKLPNLKYLSIGRCNDITEQSLDGIKNFKSLGTLGVNAQHINKENMSEIVNLPYLDTLSFMGQNKFQKNAISKLKRNRPYSSIAITGGELKNVELETLSTKLKVKSLFFEKITFKDDQLAILAKTNASSLTLCECIIGKDKIKDLAKNKSLKNLHLTKSQLVSPGNIMFLEKTLGARCQIKTDLDEHVPKNIP